MKIVFFGTPQFSADVLEYLIASKVNVVGVISKPDKPKGRSLVPEPVPVKEVTLKHGIPLYQPEKVSDLDFAPILEAFQADLFVVVAYGEILKDHVLKMTPFGCINLHASLLPKYRGAAPIQQAIIDGEKESGVTIMHLVRKMDAGEILEQVKVEIPLEMTYGELQQKLLEVGKEALLRVIQKSSKGRLVGVSQDESQVTYAHKIELEQCEIDWEKPAIAIHNLIRGVNPEPGAWCYVKLGEEKKRLKIFKSYPHPDTLQSKQIVQKDKNTILIGAGEGSLQPIEVQLEGKKRMSMNDFYRGIHQGHLVIL